ncbi:MAG: VWA domain-containing protein [Sedimentisphaerales bacterium]|nr:VWA domain-containing protein [Sedimentisphaerales bacterium]
MRLGNYDALWLLFCIVVMLIPAYVWNFYRKRRGLRRLAESSLLGHINNSVSVGRQVFKMILLMITFAVIVIALTRPAWNPQPRPVKRQGRDVVILLDVSRSMLAEDLRPNRLERAKLAINDLIDRLGGDRIGIITFAGNSSVKCPLTQDYAFVRMVLDQLTTESTTRGGTNVGDAIRDAADKLFDEEERQYKDIILITDGEDHDSAPVDAAAKAGQIGIRIIAVGLGNETQGTRIPLYDERGNRSFLTYEGREVWTKLDGKTLRDIATATPGGRYIPVETGTFDLGQIYEDLVTSAQKRELESMTAMQYDERFQVFLFLGIVILLWEALVSERRKA